MGFRVHYFHLRDTEGILPLSDTQKEKTNFKRPIYLCFVI